MDFISKNDNVTYELGDSLRVELNGLQTTVSKAAKELGLSISWINKMFLRNNFENKLELEIKGNKLNLGLYGTYVSVVESE